MIIFNKIIYILIIFCILSPSFFVGSNAETFDNVYVDKRSFDILDVCNRYITYGDGTSADNVDITDNAYADWEIIRSPKIDLPDATKPTKTIYFDNAYSNLILISKLVYDWGVNDEFKIHLYYEPAQPGISQTKTDIDLFFKDYHDENEPDEMVNNYGTWGKDKHLWESPAQQNQWAHQRLSNVDNEESHNASNMFGSYKKYEGNSSWTDWSVTQTYQKKNIEIPIFKWTTLTIKSDDIVDDGDIYKFSNFINFGIGLSDDSNSGDIIIIDSIEIIRKDLNDEINNIPCLEYYEFKQTTTFADIVFFNIDFVIDDYDTPKVIAFNLSIVNSGGNVYLRSYVNGTVRYDAYDTAPAGSPFLGYQLNIQKSLENSNYRIYLNFKYGSNTRSAGGIITYKHSSVIFVLSAPIKYILDVQYYDEISQTDNKLEFSEMSHKWDMLDNAFTVIDVDSKGDTLLVKDIDSSGFRFPSLNDIKKIIISAFNPLFRLLIGISDLVIEPLLDMLGLLDIVIELIDDLSSLASDIFDLLDAIQPVIDTIFDAIDGLEGFVEDIEGNIGFIFGIIDLVFTAVSSFIALIELIATTMITEITSFLTFGMDFIIEAITFSIATIALSLSLIALTFMYTIIIKTNAFNNTGDLNDLLEIALVFEKIAMFMYNLFLAIWSLITSLLPF